MKTSPEEDWNPERYAANARYVSDLGMPVVALLAPRSGERILDLGCGDGVLTAKLAKPGCAVVGVDASPEMVAAARGRGIDAEVMDGHALSFVDPFDAVFSNAALHWMKHPEPVIDGVWHALKPGGRFVGEMGGLGNVGTIVRAVEAALATRGIVVECPWYFPCPEAYARLLASRGFTVSRIELIPRPTALPGDVSGWLDTFARPYLTAVSKPDRSVFVAEVVEMLRPVLRGADRIWYADYVRLRFSAARS
jgi:trans-aconitate methyltransferase